MPNTPLTIYQQAILDHYHHPHHQGQLDQPTHQGQAHNSLCGDQLSLYLCVDNQGNIKQAAWQGQGCAISQASADILCQTLINRPFSAIAQLTDQQLLDQLHLDLRPSRHKCALLCLKAAQDAAGV